MSTGKIGFKAKIFGCPIGGTYSGGGGEQEIKLYAKYDTENKDVKIGASHTQKITLKNLH